MKEYGAAYLYNMMPVKINLTLNRGRKRIIDGMSLKEPFIPSYVEYRRNFDDRKIKDCFGIRNIITYAPGGKKNRTAEDKKPANKNWPINRDIQGYIFFDCVLLRYGGKGVVINLKNPLIPSPLEPNIPKNHTVYFFNMTDQSIDLTYNNNKQKTKTIEALSPYPPFTPSLVTFAPYTRKNDIRCRPRDPNLSDLLREFSFRVNLRKWAPGIDIQVYIFNNKILVRKGGYGL